MSFTSNLSFVRKNPVTTAVATITLAAGVIYTLLAGSNNNTIVHQIKTSDGRSKLYQTSSGSQVGSGDILVADQKTGSGKITLDGSDGGKICIQYTDGAGYTRFDCLNGTCTAAIATGNECP